MKFKLRLPGLFLLLGSLFFCKKAEPIVLQDQHLNYKPYSTQASDQSISRQDYVNQLYGFWLGQCIANWTGLITEMDKIGGQGLNGKGAGFYTRVNWQGPDEPNIWGSNVLRDTIDFYFEPEGGIWGADDDTDIEYMYQHLLYTHKTPFLSPMQIREGWLKHIKAEEENYLWVSNQNAFDLMEEGLEPPATGQKEHNPGYEMIEAQLTTEIFGLFAPGRPDIALKMAALPIQTTASGQAQAIAEFYVIMHALAAGNEQVSDLKTQVQTMANEARKHLSDDTYPARMYDYVLKAYQAGLPWEAVRDSLHEKYQVRQEDGYLWSTLDTVCHGCFAAGINFGASIISLLYGEGDIRETIKIGALCGWDSDNPTATWGGLLGFMLGRTGVEKAFGRQFADQFNIHRTRQNFPREGVDDFQRMAEEGVFIVDRVIQEQLGGGIDLDNNVWYIPAKQ